MKISKRKLQMIIAEEIARAELSERRRRARAKRLSESRRAGRARIDESGRRIVEATPEMINRIIREELHKLRSSNRISETKKRRLGLI